MHDSTDLPVPERTGIREDSATLFVSLELSRSTWVATLLAPGSKKMSKHTLAGGDGRKLLDLLARWPDPRAHSRRAPQTCGTAAAPTSPSFRWSEGNAESPISVLIALPSRLDDAVTTDPRTAGRTPPQPRQQQEPPGFTDELNPRPDHGEHSYRGCGKLEGRAALITGADSGIGRAVAIAFAREGADVLISYLCEHEDAKETARWVEEAAGGRC